MIICSSYSPRQNGICIRSRGRGEDDAQAHTAASVSVRRSLRVKGLAWPRVLVGSDVTEEDHMECAEMLIKSIGGTR